MDEILLKLETKFHPLHELDFKYVNEISLVNRKNIRILSYNIFLRPPPIKNNEDDYKNERLANFIHCLEDYDVVCLQEMFGSYNFRKQNIIKLAKKCGFFFVSEPPLPSFFSSYMVDGGLLILSR